MSNLTPITGGKDNTTTPIDDGPKKQLYVFELKSVDNNSIVEEQAFGLLSYGHAFVSVIEDANTPLFMVPYDRILAIKTDHVL